MSSRLWTYTVLVRYAISRNPAAVPVLVTSCQKFDRGRTAESSWNHLQRMSWSIPNVASATPVTGGSWSIPNMGMQSSWEQQAAASAMARRQRMGMQLGGSWSIPNSSALSHNFGSMSVPNPNAPRSLAGSVEVPNPNAGDLQPATPMRPWWLKNPSAEDMEFGTMTREKLQHHPVPVRVPWTTLVSAAHRHLAPASCIMHVPCVPLAREQCATEEPARRRRTAAAGRALTDTRGGDAIPAGTLCPLLHRHAGRAAARRCAVRFSQSAGRHRLGRQNGSSFAELVRGELSGWREPGVRPSGAVLRCVLGALAAWDPDVGKCHHEVYRCTLGMIREGMRSIARCTAVHSFGMSVQRYTSE